VHAHRADEVAPAPVQDQRPLHRAVGARRSTPTRRRRPTRATYDGTVDDDGVRAGGRIRWPAGRETSADGLHRRDRAERSAGSTRRPRRRAPRRPCA
jgi:hypothetical protein